MSFDELVGSRDDEGVSTSLIALILLGRREFVFRDLEA